MITATNHCIFSCFHVVLSTHKRTHLFLFQLHKQIFRPVFLIFTLAKWLSKLWQPFCWCFYLWSPYELATIYWASIKSDTVFMFYFHDLQHFLLFMSSGLKKTATRRPIYISQWFMHEVHCQLWCVLYSNVFGVLYESFLR